LIGKTMAYVDNQRDSDVVVFCLHGIGSDHTDFTDFVRGSVHRVVAVSLVGFDSGAPTRHELSLDDHNRLVEFFFSDVIGSMGARHVVAVGHSSGCDHLSGILGSETEPPILPNGLIFLGPSFSLGEGLVTGPYSRLTDDPADILDAIRTVSSTAQNLDDWIAAHEYLIRAFKKFRYDVAPLRRVASDLIARRDLETVYGEYRRLCARVPVVRCVFASDDAHEREDALRFHLQDDALGPAFSEDMFVDVDVGHMELRLAPTIESVLEPVVDLVRGRKAR
jgi:pimeloyl-ACP methyl ester carboxylesterase